MKTRVAVRIDANVDGSQRFQKWKKQCIDKKKKKQKKKQKKKKKRLEKSPGSATITNRSPSQTPRGKENRQIQTSTNLTNVRKALRLALSSQSEVIAILKGPKNTRTK